MKPAPHGWAIKLAAWRWNSLCYHARRAWSKALMQAVQDGADWEPTGRISH